MRRCVWILFAASILPLPLAAKTVVFWQAGFPTVASQPIDRATLDKALTGLDPLFADVESISAPETLSNADLLVLPYGSALPVEAWKGIERYLNAGGNLLVIGGQPLRTPISLVNGKYQAVSPQDTYSRVLGFRHTYEVPVERGAKFQWRQGYSWLPSIAIRAQRFFTVEGRLNGLGYMADATGLLVAAPVIVADHTGGGPDSRMLGSRVVALDFDPEPGYWQSEDGVSLIRQTAEYARQAATDFSVETLFSAIRPEEPPVVTVHLRIPRQETTGKAHSGHDGEVKLELSSEKEL